MTVFELAAVGIASILVPYPHAVDDHQSANAAYLADAGAAIIRQQNELEAPWLAQTLREFSGRREKLIQMAQAARELAMPDAARTIADACMKAGGGV